MSEPFDHTVLIVDDEEQIGKALGRLMRGMGVKYVYVSSGREALDCMEKASHPFSMILSDQRMPEMMGSVFLQKAKEISPDTIRFLITGYADADAVTESVNKGSIHRYISKPWDNKVLVESVKAGLGQYELIMESHRLFALAKEQNAKLYKLNIDLKKSTEIHQKALLHKDQKITDLNAVLEKGFENKNYINEIQALLKQKNMTEKGRLNSLYAAIIAELFEQFREISTQYGFMMPQPTDSSDLNR